MFEPEDKGPTKIGLIGVADHVDDIYKQNCNENISRYAKINKRFLELFSEKCKLFVRVPAVATIPQDSYKAMDLNSSIICLEQDLVLAFSERTHDEDIMICSMDRTKYPKIQQNADNPLKYRVPEIEDKHNTELKHYNVVISGAKAFFNERNLIGKRKSCNILIDSSIPDGEGLGCTQNVMMGVYQALYKVHGGLEKLSYEKMLEDLGKHYHTLRCNDNISELETKRHMKLLLESDGRILIKENDPVDDKWARLDCGISYLNCLRKNSEIQNKIITSKKFIENRVALRLLGIQNFKTFIGLEDYNQRFGYTWETQKEAISEYLDDRQYTIREIEELIEEDLSNVIQDMPAVVETLSNYFSLNPRRFFFALKIFRTFEVYIRLSEQNRNIKQNFLASQPLGAQIQDYTNQLLDQNEIKSKELDNALSIIRSSEDIQAFVFTGRRFLNNFMCITDQDKAKETNEYQIKNYLKANQESLQVFDDMIKYGFCSSISKGVLFQDPTYEIWY